MDTKALAKSKRAHSQHHSKKSHSIHKAKALPDGSENARNLKKSLGNQAAEKAKNPAQSRRASGLPSNWDRYDEEYDSGPENPSGDASPGQSSDVILPKSKGADYRHLIAEAQAESQSKMSISSDGLSSLDDILHDEFSRLVGSMVSARGEGLLSWIGNDNFVIEEGTASSHEVAFFSLNLNAIAKQLEKVDLHERLYIEADILLPELCIDQSKAIGNQESSHSHKTQDTEAVSTTLDESGPRDFAEKLETTDERIEPAIHRADLLEGSTLSSPDPSTMNRVKDRALNSGQSEESSDSDEAGIISKKKSSAFEAKSAEAELDMLLDSLGETNVQNSATRTSSSMPKLPAASFDDVLDDLLEHTSSLVRQNQTSSSSSSSSSSSQPVRKSKALDDFDSWLDTI